MPYDGLPSGSRNIHHRTHFPDGFGNTDEDRPADDGMADVQLLDFRDRGNGTDVPSRESVTGVDRKANLMADARRCFERVKRAGVILVVRVASGMQLDRDCAEIARASDCVFVRVDEQARTDQSLT